MAWEMSLKRLLNFFSGNVSRRTLVSALVPLIFVFHFGTLILAVAVLGKLGIHEILARASALGLGIGIICFSWCAHRGSAAAVANRRLYPRTLVVSWTILTSLGLITLIGCVCSVLIPKIGVLGLLPIYQLFRHSPLWHLAFWEWVGSAAVFLFLARAALLLPSDGKG
jgi:hypothetical protein